MRKRAIVLAACALVQRQRASFSGPAATATSERATAGTVDHRRGPGARDAELLSDRRELVHDVTLAISPMLAPGMFYDQNAKLVPMLFDGAAKLVKTNPLTVTFRFKASAKWSDGRQITGNDFLATYRTIMDRALGHHLARGLGGHREDESEGQEQSR